MTLGTNIQRLRKEHNLSQGDLADALDISRQSVSKWETDTSTPDLDKLLKLSEIFNVSLDELIKGIDTPSPTLSIEQSEKHEPIPTTIKTGLEPRQIAGIILLCMAFLIVLICTLIGDALAGFIFALPFLVCGLICMFVKKHTGIYCGWAVNILVLIYLQLATGSNYSIAFNPYVYTFANPIAIVVSWFHLILIILLIVCTIRAFRHISVTWSRSKQSALMAGWLLYVILHSPFIITRLTHHIVEGISFKTIISLSYVSIACGIIRMILLTVLIIYTLSWYKWHKAKKAN